MAKKPLERSMEETTGFLMVRAARAMKKALDSELNKFGLTSSQQTILSLLKKKDGLSLSEIGKSVFLDKAAITGLADRLEKDGFVERRRDSPDRRVIQLFLSEKGRRLIRKTDSIVTAVDHRIIKFLPDSELSKLRNMLINIWDASNNRKIINNPGSVKD
ncbi:MAG: MarR family transcriptional regulator [Candidatus Neomarinimicrobiota bacterium]